MINIFKRSVRKQRQMRRDRSGEKDKNETVWKKKETNIGGRRVEYIEDKRK